MALIRFRSSWYFVWQTLKLLTFTTKMFFFLFLFKLQRFSGFCEEKNVTSLVLRRQNIFCINVLHFFVYLLEDELKLTLLSNEILDRPKGIVQYSRLYLQRTTFLQTVLIGIYIVWILPLWIFSLQILKYTNWYEQIYQTLAFHFSVSTLRISYEYIRQIYMIWLHQWCNGKRARLKSGRSWVQASVGLNQRL